MGGGLELVPGGDRHGPADPAYPPPGGGWQPLLEGGPGGRLVGFSRDPQPGQAELAVEVGERLGRERKDQLVRRLDHKLRSALLVLQESARSAAFGRPEMLETLYDQAQEVSRRAVALATAAVDPREPARAVVLAAALQLAAPGAGREVPNDAIVWAPEPGLVDALARLAEWLGGDDVRFLAEEAGAWWRLGVSGGPQPLAVPELGEPLIRILVDTHLGGWLDTGSPQAEGPVAIYLPAHRE